jgi:2-polyprenyl-3-methyl-5-hydroxy-6-metoxy-1,4-benzoquinol methylase
MILKMNGDKHMVVKKILSAAVNPRKWGKLGEQGRLLFTNIVKHRSFSTNLNSKRYWNDKLSEFENFWRNENYYYLFDLFPEDKEFSLLDIGCALGDGCELLQEKFPRAKITGIDISDVGIEKAKKKTKKVNYRVMDILKDPIPEKYDYIIIVQTLEHFDDPFVVVDKCLGHIKSALIVSTPYYPESSGKITEVSEHRYTFNENTFKNYKSKVLKVTDFVKETNSQCIIFEIKSK